jgi:bidirectional [NiFe] hydrogenase diaphorase subunit
MDLTELLEIGEKERQAERSIRIRVCVAAGCLSANAQAVKQSLETALTEAGLTDSVQVAGVGCIGLCSGGPLVAVDPENILYEKVTPADASIVSAFQGGALATARQADFNHPFFTKQVPIVLNSGGSTRANRITSPPTGISRSTTRSARQAGRLWTPSRRAGYAAGGAGTPPA